MGRNRLVWMFAALDTIWMMRNDVIQRDEKRVPKKALHIISAKIRNYSLAFKDNHFTSTGQVKEVKQMEERKLNIEEMRGSSLALWWKDRKTKWWLVAGLVKNGEVVTRQSKKVVNTSNMSVTF